MWIQGSILNVCGSILVNLAANLLKLAHNVEEIDRVSPTKQEALTRITETRQYSMIRQYCCSSTRSPIYAGQLYWRLGASLFAAGSVINFLSLSMAAQSLLATLGGVQFVSNIFFGKCILGEKVTRKGLIATGVIVIGLTVAVSFSDHASTRYSSAGLIALYDRTYVTFILCVAATLILAELTYAVYTASEKAGRPLLHSSIVRPVTYSMVSATVGTQSVLQSKCLAELLRGDIILERVNDNDLFAGGLVYIVLTAFLLGMVFWLYRLNNALKLFDGLVIIPIIQVFWVTSAILQGGMFFKEFEEMKVYQSVLFLTGVIIVFFGVYLIATSQNNDGTSSAVDNSVHSDDRMKDAERGEGDVLKKRGDNNVMIITCIGSPFKYERKKLGNKNYSNNSCAKNGKHDGRDQRFDHFAVVGALEDEEEEGIEGDIEMEELENEIDGKSITETERETDGVESSHLLESKQSQKNTNYGVIHDSHTATRNPLTLWCDPTSTSPHNTSPSTAMSSYSPTTSNGAVKEDLLKTSPTATNSDLKSFQFENELSNIHAKIPVGKGEATLLSSNTRKDVRPAPAHLRERSGSSCGLLELISEEEDEE